ncbi:MAG: hypothetical protein SYR96_00960 [Actinomycetota bacterium]|nr:hypothetical protein [Actinomycetota bacterium]
MRAVQRALLTDGVRADAALARAIAGTGARLVLVVDGEVALAHGIGAVLRYADASSAADRAAR